MQGFVLLDHSKSSPPPLPPLVLLLQPGFVYIKVVIFGLALALPLMPETWSQLVREGIFLTSFVALPHNQQQEEEQKGISKGFQASVATSG